MVNVKKYLLYNSTDWVIFELLRFIMQQAELGSTLFQDSMINGFEFESVTQPHIIFKVFLSVSENGCLFDFSSLVLPIYDGVQRKGATRNRKEKREG